MKYAGGIVPFMSRLLVCSEPDLPSVNMRESLLSFHGWEDLGDDGTNRYLAYGDTFMVSNQRTLGCSEQEILENLNTLVMQIIKQERVRREYVLARNYNMVEDQVYRAYGMLKYTKQMDEKDAVTLLSRIMLGVDTGIIKLKDEGNLYQMIMNVQSNVLQARLGKNVGSITRERLRAEYINKNLPELQND